MLGASDSENEAYRIGSHFDEGDMLKYFHASNLQFYQPGSGIDPSNNLGGDCRYNYVLGIDGGSGGRSGLRNCQLSPKIEATPASSQIRRFRRNREKGGLADVARASLLQR